MMAGMENGLTGGMENQFRLEWRMDSLVEWRINLGWNEEWRMDSLVEPWIMLRFHKAPTVVRWSSSSETIVVEWLELVKEEAD
ncbi:unnamed protein product [Ilex paraguariensis]|uniref:Uncharacterized protein n=1 Tax=Ilex paraguariensis TaxID=185542 RepID=A0ABC8RWB7_9AQUA